MLRWAKDFGPPDIGQVKSATLCGMDGMWVETNLAHEVCVTDKVGNMLSVECLLRLPRDKNDNLPFPVKTKLELPVSGWHKAFVATAADGGATCHQYRETLEGGNKYANSPRCWTYNLEPPDSKILGLLNKSEGCGEQETIALWECLFKDYMFENLLPGPFRLPLEFLDLHTLVTGKSGNFWSLKLKQRTGYLQQFGTGKLPSILWLPTNPELKDK